VVDITRDSVLAILKAQPGRRYTTGAVLDALTRREHATRVSDAVRRSARASIRRILDQLVAEKLARPGRRAFHGETWELLTEDHLAEDRARAEARGIAMDLRRTFVGLGLLHDAAEAETCVTPQVAPFGGPDDRAVPLIEVVLEGSQADRLLAMLRLVEPARTLRREARKAAMIDHRLTNPVVAVCDTVAALDDDDPDAVDTVEE